MNEAIDFNTNTGAEVSVIPDQVYKELGCPPLTPPNQTLKGPTNEVLSIKGRFSVTLAPGDFEAVQELYVTEGLHRSLLGRLSIESLQLVQ